MYNKRTFIKHCNHQHNEHFNGHFEHPFKRTWQERERMGAKYPPANVREMDDKYELHLFAPGYEKKDFVIALIDQNISISMKDKIADDSDWKRQEYVPGGFSRQFELNEKVDRTAVEATYTKGVLIISLPKLEGFETSREKIEVV